MSDRALRIAVAGLALTGAAIAGYLTWAKYADATITCSTGGCETVQSSEYAELLGLPVPVLGLIGYLAVFATALSTSEAARLLGAALALGGLVFSIYLVFVQVFAIEALCQWCLGNDVTMALLAAAALGRVLLERGAPP